ncbi:MAG TPA: capsular biosynthesis protein CpsI, partial [Aurantimonas sp.]|nr:capsular biosynthesis protein CpsI [Aurantimonas sp.]
DSGLPDPATSNAPFRLFNIGNNAPVKLTDYVGALEAALGRKAQREMLPLQPGDLVDTFADVTELERAVGYRPATPVGDGVRAFVDWYRSYYED